MENKDIVYDFMVKLKEEYNGYHANIKVMTDDDCVVITWRPWEKIETGYVKGKKIIVKFRIATAIQYLKLRQCLEHSKKVTSDDANYLKNVLDITFFVPLIMGNVSRFQF